MVIWDVDTADLRLWSKIWRSTLRFMIFLFSDVQRMPGSRVATQMCSKHHYYMYIDDFEPIERSWSRGDGPTLEKNDAADIKFILCFNLKTTQKPVFFSKWTYISLQKA